MNLCVGDVGVKVTELVPPQMEGSLVQIQFSFERYQREAFPHRPSEFLCLELCGEAGELANLEKKIWRDPSKSLPVDRLEEEAADVFITLMNYANSRNIDLSKAVTSKLKEIEARRCLGLMGQTHS